MSADADHLAPGGAQLRAQAGGRGDAAVGDVERAVWPGEEAGRVEQFAHGRYVRAHMPPSAQAVRLAGDALMGLGAHRRSPVLLMAGAVVIAVGWSHAAWPPTSRR